MEIHNLSFSMRPDEIEKWLVAKSQTSQLQILAFSSSNDQFELKFKYKAIVFPLRFKMINCEHSLIHLEILSLPSILSFLPLSLLFSGGGVRLQGRDLWLDLSVLSGGRIASLQLQEITFRPESIGIRLQDLVIREPFA